METRKGRRRRGEAEKGQMDTGTGSPSWDLNLCLCQESMVRQMAEERHRSEKKRRSSLQHLQERDKVNQRPMLTPANTDSRHIARYDHLLNFISFNFFLRKTHLHNIIRNVHYDYAMSPFQEKTQEKNLYLKTFCQETKFFGWG